MEKNLLIQFECDFPRQGTLSGLFICTEKELVSCYGKDTTFYDELGKHSQVTVGVEENDKDFKIVSEDQELISSLITTFKGRTFSGFNPIERILDNEEYTEE